MFTNNERKEIRNAITKFLAIVAVGLVALALSAIFSSCSPEDRRFSNLYIEWEGENPKELSIKYGDGPWEIVPNGEEFHVSLDCYTNGSGEPRYKLEYAGDFKFHFAYFNGLYNYVKNKHGQVVQSYNMELPFDYKTEWSFKSTGPHLKQDRYEISLGYTNW